jgi:hypothetical protein
MRLDGTILGVGLARLLALSLGGCQCGLSRVVLGWHRTSLKLGTFRPLQKGRNFQVSHSKLEFWRELCAFFADLVQLCADFVQLLELL